VSLWVLDTSVVAKWLLPEEGSDRAAPYLDAVAGGEGEVAVPSSLFYEMSNLLWVRRRDGLDAETAARYSRPCRGCLSASIAYSFWRGRRSPSRTSWTCLPTTPPSSSSPVISVAS
jgi:hypothetical protein